MAIQNKLAGAVARRTEQTFASRGGELAGKALGHGSNGAIRGTVAAARQTVKVFDALDATSLGRKAEGGILAAGEAAANGLFKGVKAYWRGMVWADKHLGVERVLTPARTEALGDGIWRGTTKTVKAVWHAFERFDRTEIGKGVSKGFAATSRY